MLQLKHSVVVCAIVLGTALGMQAAPAPAPCPTSGNFVTLALLLPGGACSVGDKEFFDFDFSNLAGTYSTIDHGTTAIGFEFKPTALIAFGGGTSHLTMSFRVVSTGADISDASLDLTGVTFRGPGTNSASIVESLHPSGGSHQTLTVTAPGMSSSGVSFSPVDAVAVTKTATATTASGITNFAQITSFNETFSQVPEPRTMLLFGTGLLLIGIVLRRRQGRAKAGNIGLTDVA